MTAPLDLAHLRALLAAATPGPWRHVGDRAVVDSADADPQCITKAKGPGRYCSSCDALVLSAATREDAALVVALVNAAPALLAIAKNAADLLHAAACEDEAAGRRAHERLGQALIGVSVGPSDARERATTPADEPGAPACADPVCALCGRDPTRPVPWRDPMPAAGPTMSPDAVARLEAGFAEATRRLAAEQRARAAAVAALGEAALAFTAYQDAEEYARRMYHNYQEWTDNEWEPIRAAEQRMQAALRVALVAAAPSPPAPVVASARERALAVAEAAVAWADDTGDCHFCGAWESTSGKRHDEDCPVGAYLATRALAAGTVKP